MSNTVDFSRMKFYCDENLCIDCNGCVVACKEAHEVPVGVNRRKVITVNEGIVGKEISVSMACMHCTDAPCQQVCPTDCFYIRTDGIVLHDKDKCIGCGYCLFACPFGAPQCPRDGAFGTKGKMDKCTMCASMCSTKALLVGDANEVALIKTYRASSQSKGIATESYGW